VSLFIAGDICLSRLSIHKVVLLESSFSVMKGHDPIPARVVINDNYLFASDEGLDALKQLHDCDYLTYIQFDHMRGRYEKMLASYKLATEGNFTALAESA